jgi:hypothetical protein
MLTIGRLHPPYGWVETGPAQSGEVSAAPGADQPESATGNGSPRTQGAKAVTVMATRTRFTPRVFRACERVRSKRIWTLTYPKNRLCGYAVNMLRITP